MFVHNQAGTLHAHKTARKTPAIKYLPGQFFSNQQIKVLLSAMGTIQAWQHQVGNIKAGRLDKINACTYSTAANMRAALQLQLSGLAAFLLSASLLFIKLDISKLSVSSTCDRDVGIQVTQLNNPSFFCLRWFLCWCQILADQAKIVALSRQWERLTWCQRQETFFKSATLLMRNSMI